MNIHEKIASLLESANGCTGAGDEDLTSAIRTLISGYVDNSLVLDDVVEWYKNDVSDAYRYIKSLGGGYVHHLCLADMHYNQNYRHSADIVKALQATGRFGKVFLLGDNTDGNGVTEQITALEEDFGDLNGQICLICGNHDPGATNKSAYAGMMSEDTDIVYGDENYLYYYFDDDEKKIRYIFINSSSGATAKTAQVNWFNGLVDNLPDGYGVVAFSHYAFTKCYDMNGNEMTATDGSTTNSGFINKLANKRISSGGESVIAVLHGHYHWPDFTRFFGIQQIGLATDANSLKASPKVAGTNTEQSILILSVNTSKHIVKTKVIGWVPNEYYRALDINYAVPITEWEYGYYLGTGNAFVTATDGALLPQVIPLNGADSLWVWNDLYKTGGYYYDQRVDGEPLSNSRTAVDSNVHSRGVVQLAKGTKFSSANGFLLSTRIWGATDASEWEHIHWSTVAPIFTDWNDVVWLKDYCISNSNYSAQTGFAVMDKMISVSPGQIVSFHVNDESWTTNRIYFYLHSTPLHKYFAGNRIGVTNGQTSFTTTIPNGIHYLLIDAANLADYTDKAVVTITNPITQYDWEYTSGDTTLPQGMTGTATDAGDSLLIAKPELYFPFGDAELEVVAKGGNTVTYMPQIGLGESLSKGFKCMFEANTGALMSNISGSLQNYTSDNSFHTIKLRYENGACTLTIDGTTVTGTGVTTQSCLSGIGAYELMTLDSNASIYIKSIKYRRL